MSDALRLVIVAEHPARTIGFTRVANDIAAQLVARGVAVTYVGFFSELAPPSGATAYHVVPVADPAGAASAVAGLVDGRRLDVLFVGRVLELRALDDRLRALGVRDRIGLGFYDAVDFAPAPPGIDDVVSILDRFVPATVRAEQLLAHLSATEPAIPHSVDLSVFEPVDDARRQHIRHETFGIGDTRQLVGTFSRNSANKRFDLAARVIAHLAHGSHARCDRCGRTSVAPLGLDGRLGATPESCPRCGSARLRRAQPIELVWQLHTEDADRATRASSGGWDLDMLIERYALDEVLWWQRELGVGQGVPIGELVERMAACDVHLLLSDCGGWELTMLETAACGVANVVADAGAFGEYTAPFAEVVPVIDRHWPDHGHRGEVDIGAAVAAVAALFADPVERRQLAERGIQTATSFSVDVVGQRWYERLVEWQA